MGNPLDDILAGAEKTYEVKPAGKEALAGTILETMAGKTPNGAIDGGIPPMPQPAKTAGEAKIVLPAATPKTPMAPPGSTTFDETAVIEAIAQAETMLTGFRGTVLKGRALEALGRLKRVSGVLDEAVLGLIGEANKQFQVIQHANPALKTFAVGEGVTSRAYTYAKKYVYPDLIKKLEATLKIDKATAVKTGTAMLVEKNFDMNKDKLFTISV